MSHTVQEINVIWSLGKAHQRPKNTALPRKTLQLTTRLLDLQSLYTQSQLSQSLSRHLQTISRSRLPITCILSLGLGSLLVSRSQPRRLKQLAILLVVRDYLEEGRNESIAVFAQDPNLTRVDEQFLISLGIQISRTPTGSELGEAVSLISPSTLVYSPFLTLEAYEQPMVGSELQYLLGDDFDELLQKWPERSAERKQVEEVSRQGLSKYRRKAVAGEGFWIEDDETFPMAMYSKKNGGQSTQAKAGS
ncbi:hypothetical protein EKO04_004078 [Ascochyta lentis]|uniref:SRR1-like domain-containing protein n=1 Tax=Ascochyta lentis TaxID=205686 RepID=A0A8H7J7T0_9PLEO|nr:hypothetical protein EKO04_004078 [Ascochyta lentis]